MSAFQMFQFLKDSYSKQNAYSLGTLHKTITKAKLSDHASIKDYGRSLIEASKRLNQLGHPVESWILTFYFLDGLGSDYEIFRQSQNAKYAEASIKPPKGKIVDGKVVFEEDTTGYTKIEDLLQILMQDQANKAGSSSDIVMRAGQPPRGHGSGRKGSNRGRFGGGERGRGSSSYRGRGGGATGGTESECSTCFSPGHVNSTCFYTHPDIAPEAFNKKYLTEQARKAALSVRRAGNLARKKDEKEKKQGSDSGGAFMANACLPINMVAHNAICLPADLKLVNSSLSLAQMRGIPWYIDSFSSLTLGDDIRDFDDLNYNSQRSFQTASGEWITITAKGTVRIMSVGVKAPLTIKNAYFCPEISANLISFGQLARNGCNLTTLGLDMTIFDPRMNPIIYG